MNQNTLLQPLQVGSLNIKNRMCMAALTRQRCETNELIPSDLHVEYYTQRASAGFILTECVPISDRSIAFPGCAGLYTDKQVEGWRKVIQSVHNKGGLMIAQIWHSGRATHSSMQGGLAPWAPSPIAIKGINRRADKLHEIPHEMTIDEINEVKQQFKASAILAKEAGFDGVQLHGAHGYIIDQFLKDNSNIRTDDYGGSIQNRCRLALEIIDLLIEVYGKGRVGIKISPISRMNDTYDSNPVALYTHLIQELNQREIAFIELKDDSEPENFLDFGKPSSKSQIADVFSTFRPFFKGVMIANGGLTPETALKGINAGTYDAVSFGKLFISNPDLVERVTQDRELNTKWDVSTFYSKGAKGYTDYGTYDEYIQQK